MAKVYKDIDRKLKRSPGVKAAVRAVAEEILAAAKARAATHSRTGTYANSLHIEQGKTDSHIVSDDPHGLSKEFGHEDKTTGREVPGVHALSGAVADVASRARR